MKRAFCILLSLLLIGCTCGCSPAKDVYALFTMAQTYDSVDIQIMEDFLSNYENYEEILQNVPDLLSYLQDITPKELADKCRIYRFTYEPGTSFAGESFLVIEDQVYHIGTAFGGYGITEFAYASSGDQDVLYFIYSFGSGIHRSHIGAFDFTTQQISDYGGLVENFLGQDIAFFLSDDRKTLGICKAEIMWSDWNTFDVTINRGAVVYTDITELEFSMFPRENF